MGSNIDVSSTGALVNQLMNPPNPMEQLNKTIQGVNALKSFQANQASADAYRQSVDPTTGEVDLGKYKALMSQGPGAWSFGPQTQQAGQAVGAVGQGTSANVKANLEQLSAAGTLMLPLYKQAISTNYVNPADAQTALDQAYQMKLVTPQQYQAYSSTLKSTQNAAGFVIGANSGIESARALALGQPGMANVGGSIQPYQPTPGALPSAAPPMQTTPTPGEVIQQQQWLAQPFGQNGTYYDKNGQAKVGSVSQWMHDFNVPYDAVRFGPNGTATAPGAPSFQLSPQPAPVAPAPAPSGGAPGGRTAAPAAAPAPVPSPAPGPSPAPAPAPQQGGTTVLPATQIQAGQDAYKQAQADAANMSDRMAPLRSALGLLRTNQDLQTGPGQQQYAQAITGIAAALNLKVPQGSTDLQELTKFLAQNIRAQQTGGTTDLGRLETEASNPNPNTQSRDALQVLLAKTLGTTRLQNAAFDYFNAKYGGPAAAATNSGRYTLETSTWKKNQDPTAYAIDELSPDQVGRYFNGLSGTFDPKTGKATGAKAQFVLSMRDAKRLYNLQPGTAPAPAPTPAPPPAPATAVPPPASNVPATPPGYMTPQQMYGGR